MIQAEHPPWTLPFLEVNMKKTTCYIGVWVFALLFIVSVVMIISHYVSEDKAENDFEYLVEIGEVAEET